MNKLLIARVRRAQQSFGELANAEETDNVLELQGGRAAGLGLVPGKRVWIQPVDYMGLKGEGGGY